MRNFDEPQPAEKTQRLRVLLVEDDPHDVELIQRALQSATPCDVRLALTEDAFKDQLEQHSPHIVISDSNVRSFDGMNALKIALDGRPDTPFLFCTGNYDSDRHLLALEEGAAGYVGKDESFQNLINAVRRLCARHLAEQEQGHDASRGRMAEPMSFSARCEVQARLHDAL